MALVKIPKTPRSAYNPDRKASELLQAQIRNLEKAIGKRSKPAAARKSISEGDAAAYIRQLGRELHRRTLLPEIAAGPTIEQRPAASAAAKRKGRKKAPTRSKGRRTRKGGRR